jgi:hypothetical protein
VQVRAAVQVRVVDSDLARARHAVEADSDRVRAQVLGAQVLGARLLAAVRAPAVRVLAAVPVLAVARDAVVQAVEAPQVLGEARAVVAAADRSDRSPRSAVANKTGRGDVSAETRGRSGR